MALSFDFLSGGGEMGALLRGFDWVRTPLGLPERWPQSLRTAVGICLESAFPMNIWWGPGLVQIYNDAYRPILGAKHPRSLAQNGRECWTDIWPVVGPLYDSVVVTGQATWSADLLLEMDRFGYLEETYFTFSYSPIRDESGGVGGVLITCTETTSRVIGERRLRLLKDLAEAASGATSDREACRRCADAIGRSPADLPFARIYLAGQDGQAEFAAGAGIEVSGGSTDWPLGEVNATGAPVLITGLEDRFSEPFPQAPSAALVLPVAAPGQQRPAAFLVAGISPRLVLDEDYRSFLHLVASHIATALSDARALEAERKRSDALAELDRAKMTFFSNISHEFRTPLTLMLGPLDDLLAQSDDRLPPESGELLRVARRNGQRLLKLVNTLLDFSRLEAGRLQADYQPVDLAAYTADLASVFRAAVEKAGMRLSVECPALPAPLYVDRDMWEKIVLNLISNAFKYTTEGEIRVSLGADGDSAVLAVRDTGIGIPEAELPNLFNRFHRVPGAQGRTHEGTGIGLALVFELAKLHGGTVAVESAPGKGSTFTVAIPFGTSHLPADRIGGAGALEPTASDDVSFVEQGLRWLPDTGLADGESLPVPAHDVTPAPVTDRRRARIVWADDNGDMREYVRRLLAKDYEVIAVSDGRKALHATLEHRPDLVLTDVMMPNLDGFGLLQAIRADARISPTPVIVLSARAGEEARVEGLQASADDYLIKPFTARELLARIGGMLAVAEVRRKAGEAIRESEERFRNMADNAPVMIWVTDPSGARTYLNRQWYAFTGRPPETGLGLGWVQAVHPADRQHAEWSFLAANGNCQAFRLEYRLRRSDGEYRWAIDSAAPRFGPAGEFLGYIGSVIDIHDRRQAEERLRQSAKMEAIGRLAGGLAHDFNNQLHALSGFADFVARDTGLGGRSRHDLLEIQKATERMASLTRQLLAFSRQQVLMPETLDLNDVVRETQAMLQRLLGSDIQMLFRLSPEPIWTRADRGQLLQVLMNLAINARDAMPDGGELTLDTTACEVRPADTAGPGSGVEPGRYAQLVVMDTGTGIAPEHLPQLFEPFFTTKDVGQGTGLGLATVHGIVTQSHGYVWAENGPHRGSKFTVLLPLAGEPGLPPAATVQPDASALRHARILVVEDEDAVRASVVRVLEAAGYEVMQAREGQDALDRLERVEGAVDAVLSDVVMPVMGGRELGRRLAAAWPDLPVVWMSGYPRDAAFGEGVLRDDQPFLQKPVAGDLLVATVRRAVESGKRLSASSSRRG
jgi:PAS domain S-box-containing protein